MKKKLFFISMGIVFALLLTACNLPTEETTIGTSTPTETLTPIDETEEPPAEDVKTPTINLAGPTLGTNMLWIDDSLLIFIPDGEFIMGASHAENLQEHPEHPEHIVDQSGFWIYRSEVTNRMYANCVADEWCTSPATEFSTDYTNPEKSKHPVVGVDWVQAQAYCAWVNGHLPTESQWEKTARGKDGNWYPWGDTEPSCDLLNFNNCFGKALPSGVFLSTTSPIRKYFAGASFYEALDMAGNVFEWVQDWYQFDYYSESPTVDPAGPTEGDLRVVRGSGFRSVDSFVPSVLRSSFPPNKYRDDLGFRCVVETPPYYPSACVYAPPPETKDCPPPTLDVTDTYCKKETGMTEFDVSEGAIVTSSGNSCSETTPNHYICYGASGGFVNVKICADCGPTEEICPPTMCADGYTLNLETCECEAQTMHLTNTFDSSGILLFSMMPSLASAPIFVPVICPPGYYFDELVEKCVPVDDPDDCFDPASKDEISEECEECPPGTTYNQETDCCEQDGTLTEELPEETITCASFTLALGTCDTPPPDVGCVNPSQYTNPGSCTAAQCSWEKNPNIHTYIAYYCTYP